MSDDLPMGWDKVLLGDLAEYLNGAAFKPTDWVNEGMPIIRIQNLTDPTKPMNLTTRIVPENLLVKDGDILVSWSATLDAFIWDRGDAWLNQHIFRVLPHEKIVEKYFLFFLLKREIANLIGTEHLHGSTMKHINRGPFLSHEVALPPLNEQRLIVDKLDRIGDRQRSARNELNHIPKLIARYKQAVLAAACSGKLTEDFRLSNSLSISSISLSEVCNSISDGDHQAPPRSETGIPFITISAINDGSLSLNKATRFVPKSYFESLSKIRKPEIDDILFTVTGSIGIPVIVDTDEPFVFQRHIAILKANKNIILAKYLLYALGSDQIQKQALNVATGTAQLTIPLGGLRNFQIQLPSLEEQKEIVRRVEKMFAKIDKMEEEYQKAVKLCDRLEQATLAKAFRGELVPQDPNDEPASVLLEQVKREKEKGKKGVKSK
ncbi:MAG: restriction endonuclease subunit S [Pseudanabaena sp. M051S1SP2A07QC]|nr:restriction endonuclease subunit S [Pseudanabaena sp. M051S1SP2A07QC]